MLDKPADRCDALVIGGGPAGAAAAVLLAQAGWSVILVERKVFPRRKVCGEYLSATNWPLLEMLGVADRFMEMAGPPITRTAIFVGKTAIEADLPQPHGMDPCWGRALSREHLDALLLNRAIHHGVGVRQPWRCVELQRVGETFLGRIESQETQESTAVRASVVIAAHGSWEPGALATQLKSCAPHPRDLLAFKAHFRQASLPMGLMPLLSFRGGYGGMVHCDNGMMSLSCCLRRGQLQQLQRRHGEAAGEAVLRHLIDWCRVVRPILDGAMCDAPWLSAGPIRPGIRLNYRDGVFVVGNAAGEAHPVVAEGISMAIQSAWLLAQRLIPARLRLQERRVTDEIGRLYETDWRRCFSPRIRAAAMIAHWAMRPNLVAATVPFVRQWPRLLTWGAQLSGKARLVIHEPLATP